MEHDSRLSEYLELRRGTALDAVDLAVTTTDDIEAGYSYLCIDWIAVGDRLFLLTARPGQHPLRLRRLLPTSRSLWKSPRNHW